MGVDVGDWLGLRDGALVGRREGVKSFVHCSEKAESTSFPFHFDTCCGSACLAASFCSTKSCCDDPSFAEMAQRLLVEYKKNWVPACMESDIASGAAMMQGKTRPTEVNRTETEESEEGRGAPISRQPSS